jgi:archaellum biogenesis ATPase FlaH/5S rRNA maturation endonuclease (ribonuclease M5)
LDKLGGFVSKESGQRINQKFSCIANEFDDKDSCNSSDALSIWQKEDAQGNIYYDGYCWSCNQSFSEHQVHNSSHAKELGIEEGEVRSEIKLILAPKVEPLTSEQIGQLKDTVGFPDRPYRSITPEVMKFFGHMVKRNNKNVPVEVYYPETEDDKVTGFKIRILPKSWNKVGRTGRGSQLSGQFRYKSAGKRILIVGGENDKAAAYQALQKYTHVVSPTTGEGSSAKQCAAQYEWLDQYEEIYLGLDNDEKGKQATEAVCKVLPANKVKIVTWSDKDPHKLLEDGKEVQISRDFFNAKDFVNNGIKSAAEAMAEVEEFLTAPKITLPAYLHRLQEAMRGGIKSTGAIVNVIGDTSIGKSYFTDNLEQHWFFNSPLVPTIISLERTAGELLTDHYSLYLKKNLSWFKDGDDAIRYLNQPDIKEMCNDLVYAEDGVSRFLIVDERNGTVETLKKQVEISMKKYGSRMFIFDPLTDWLRSLPIDQQENFMMWQKLMKKEGVVFINVLHTRKPPTDKDGKVRKVSEYDILGSGTFVQSADINIVLNRNKMAECPIERNTTTVDVPKCRGGSTGEICKLYYDQETRQQYDYDDFFSGARQLNPDYKQDINVVNDEHIDYTTGEILNGDDDVVTSKF